MTFDDEHDWHGQADCSAAARSRALIACSCLSGIAALLLGAGVWAWLS